jgi:hypothetical protein
MAVWLAFAKFGRKKSGKKGYREGEKLKKPGSQNSWHTFGENLSCLAWDHFADEVEMAKWYDGK